MTAIQETSVMRETVAALLFEDFDEVLGIIVLDEPESGAVEMVEDVVREPEIDLDAIRSEAFAAGARDVTTQAEALRAAAAARLLDTLREELPQALADIVTQAEQAADAVARVVLGALATTLPFICAKHGTAEVAALAAAVLPSLVHAPQVTIRTNPEAAAGLRSVLASLEPDLHSRVFITAVDTLAVGDVRIAWEDGNATRDTRELLRAIGETLMMCGLIDEPDTLARDIGG